MYLVPNLLGAVPPRTVLPERTIAVARALRHFVVETPKVARQFIKSLEPDCAIQSIEFAVLDEHTPLSHVATLLGPLHAGHDLGLLSDAGCPGVADPGAALVNAAHRAGIAVVPLVGPSAILLALMASGLNGQAFHFHGYLPVKPDARAAALRALDDAVQKSGHTQIFIETPYRNQSLLAHVIAVCSPTTRLCVASELTTAAEAIEMRSIEEWRTRTHPDLARKPALFLLGGDAAG